MDQPQKSLLTALTILAAIAGIFGCIFAAPPFILSLREHRQHGSLRRNFEFHYNRSPRKLRAAFSDWLNTNQSLVDIAILTVDKTSLPNHFRRMQESVITSYFIAQVTALIPDQIYGARLLIDGEQKNKELIQRVRKTLSDFGHHLSDVKARDSRLEDGIQIADMIAGAVLDQLQGEPSSFDRIQHSVKFEEFEAKTRR